MKKAIHIGPHSSRFCRQLLLQDSTRKTTFGAIHPGSLRNRPPQPTPPPATPQGTPREKGCSPYVANPNPVPYPSRVLREREVRYLLVSSPPPTSRLSPASVRPPGTGTSYRHPNTHDSIPRYRTHPPNEGITCIIPAQLGCRTSGIRAGLEIRTPATNVLGRPMAD